MNAFNFVNDVAVAVMNAVTVEKVLVVSDCCHR